MLSLATAAEAAPSAAGADVVQVAIATGAMTLLTTALLVFGLGHRSGRRQALARAAAFTERMSGLPGWSALPSAIAGGALVTACFGLYWDISLHVDKGRDPGPLANPSHYFILLGLFGIFTAGWLAICLPRERPSRAALRITKDWHAPVSGVLMMACSSFALLGFPLDDFEHRLFGQDVTLWGPTHLMMLLGAAMTLVAILASLAEARAHLREREAVAPTPPPAGGLLTGELMRTLRVVSACGGLLIGLSIFQGEYDFGVPQFRLLLHPLLLAFAAGCALTAARVVAGRGAALYAMAFFVVVRGALAVIVGGIFGETLPHLPLYLAEAVLVELLALLLSTQDRPLRFGAAAGALVGSVGIVAEFGWSQIAMPIAWPAGMLPEAVAVGVVGGVTGGVLGAFLACAVRLRADVAAAPRTWAAGVASLAAFAVTVAVLIPTGAPAGGARAAVTLRDTPAGKVATVRVTPADVAVDADFFRTIAWQGKGRLHGADLRRVAPGVYESAPLPTGGTWKTAIRLAKGDVLAGVPVYLPEDTAIPAAEVPALPSFDRAFQRDKTILQRELKADTPTWLWSVAGLVVLGLTLVLLLGLGAGLVRIARSAPQRPARVAPAPAPAPALVPA